MSTGQQHATQAADIAGAFSFEVADRDGLRPDKMFKAAPPGAPLPNAELVAVLRQQEAATAPLDVSARLKDVAKYYSQLNDGSMRPQLNQAQDAWARAVAKVARNVSDLAEVLETVVMPFNKFTRKKADLKGASLHLPGLIKAVATDFSYKKIFAVKKAGGRRQYAVAIVVDVSMSMAGHLLQAASAAAMTLAAALVQANVETFSIVLFGERVRVRCGNCGAQIDLIMLWGPFRQQPTIRHVVIPPHHPCMSPAALAHLLLPPLHCR